MPKQRVLITGAGSGIGQATAQILSERGYDLALVSKTADKLDATVRSCRKYGNRIHAVPYDLSRIDGIADLVAEIAGELGGLDVLVNNAGIGASGPVVDVDLAKVDTLIDVNLRSVIHLTQACLRTMLKNPKGAIINVASIAGKQAFANSAGYCASKHGLMGFAEALFEEVREKNIKVCNICPGFVNTPMAASPGLDASKMIQAGDIAQAVLFALEFPDNACPTEIVIRPQRSPYL